ncbi:hypothetical protein SPFL3102_02844 [Sporomusaceae bacterium FL31]|nr:hypothetical protein SPFL3101_01174 [Sporomusaceae bacterium FL31]GCE35016.1 hypothetical protein SPFL3102_02844 [Sporomusaceae bacterium]
MGVNNTCYERVTLYLKKEHVQFLNKIVAEITNENQSSVGKSELVRAVLDDCCDINDWKSKALFEKICKKDEKKK